jgi:HSP20 family protein
MNTSLIRRKMRPLWMTPFGEEGPGDVFSDRLFFEWPRMAGEEWVPPVGFYEKGGNYVLNVEIPGVSKDDLSISLDKNVLTISGKKEKRREEEGANYYLQEASFGSFSRSLRLPGEINEGNVQAVYKDGILTLTMPKQNKNQTKQIKIEEG